MCQAVSGSFWDLAELGHLSPAPVSFYVHCLQVMATLPQAGHPLRFVGVVLLCLLTRCSVPIKAELVVAVVVSLMIVMEKYGFSSFLVL